MCFEKELVFVLDFLPISRMILETIHYKTKKVWNNELKRYV